MKLSIKLLSVSCLLFLAILISGCKKDESGLDIGQNATQQKSTISGLIVDELGAAVKGASVVCNGYTTTTSDYGTFLFENINIPRSRFIIKYYKSGYYDGSYASFVTDNAVTYVKRIMIAKGQLYSFQTTTGGTVILTDGTTIQFPQNNYKLISTGAAYNGLVTAYVHHLTPGTNGFFQSIPGGDLSGVDATGNSQKLVSFGMVAAELYGSSGEKLNLDAGSPAQISMPIASSQLSNASSTIKLWHFDESTAFWKEEGSASKVGNNYEYSVNHFSWWNCDQPYPRAFIKGRVLDCNGNPVANAFVFSNTVTIGSLSVYTNSNGEYFDSVPAGFAYQIQADVMGMLSNMVTVPSLIQGSSYTVPDLTYSPCPSAITGTLKNCNGIDASGIIIVRANNQSQHLYTTSGNFTFQVYPNSLCELDFYRQNNYYTTSVYSPASGSSIDIGAISVCDTISGNNLPDNTFYLDGGPFSNFICVVDSLSTDSFAFAHADLSNHMIVNFIKPGLFVMNLQIANLNTGDFAYGMQPHDNYFIGNIILNDWYYCHTDTSACSGTIKVTEMGNIGGRVKGIINGNMMVNPTDSPTVNYIVNVIGKFNVKRQ